MTDNQQTTEFNIDIGEILNIVWRNILVIILVAVISGAVTFAATFLFVSPAYQASTTLYANTSSFSLGGSTFNISSGLSSNTLVNIYMIIIRSRTTLEEVIDEAGLDMTVKDLKKMIKTSSTEGTGAFTITVTSPDPSQAELIANTIAKIIPDRISKIIDGSSVRVIDYAIIPSTRSSPNYVDATIKGLLAGAVLSLLFILVRYYFDQMNDSAIHSSDELKKDYPDIPVLASIPDMRLSKKSGYYYFSYYGSGKGGKK